VIALLQAKLKLNVLDEDGREASTRFDHFRYARLDFAFQVDHERYDDGFFGVEVIVNRAFADVGGFGDLIDRDGGDAVLRKEIDCRGDDLCADRGFLAVATRGDGLSDHGHL
jgi:hypothetical protein